MPKMLREISKNSLMFFCMVGESAKTVTLEEAHSHLPELIDQMEPGQEIIITRDNQPVATLTKQKIENRPLRRPGTLKGTVLFMAPDFNAPLKEFKEYME